MPRIPAPDPILYLVQKRFPPTISGMATRYPVNSHDRYEASFPGLATTGTNLLAYAALYPAEQLPEVERYRQELLSKSEDEIRRLWESEKERERAEAVAALLSGEAKLIYMRAVDPDYDHYCRCATWTLEEALALSFGRDPEKVSATAVAEYAKRGYGSRQARWQLEHAPKPWLAHEGQSVQRLANPETTNPKPGQAAAPPR